ncbi:MAG: phosphotransferase [Nocardiopsaceae bacterium]|jgi:spectinomycin phosphotransferase/16S rRNA (guanine(1405)-N(7))-methyltransferase|nr:phosphotransferase [Nocardiopsaceae bacterium]
MLTPPDGLSDELLVATLASNWGLVVAAIDYRAVGFGSHHWEIADAAGTRWFVTVDELRRKRQSRGETLESVLERQRHALATAVELRELGCKFVVAPVASRDDAPVVLVADEFTVSLYPFVEGKSFGWGERISQEHLHAVLDMVVAVHAAPVASRSLALADTYAIQSRDQLELALDGPGEIPHISGPYTGPMTKLLGRNRAAIRVLLDRYDELVSLARSSPSRSVLTHGEPHPGNTMLTEDGWRLIDWDTVLLAPPERDLWMVDPGDGSVFASYAASTGVEPAGALLELYRTRWDLTDLAIEVSRFLQPHKGTDEDQKAWQLLTGLTGQIGAS